MCHDVQDGSNSLHKYEEQFPAFADSREYKLLQVTKLHMFSLVLNFNGCIFNHTYLIIRLLLILQVPCHIDAIGCLTVMAAGP